MLALWKDQYDLHHVLDPEYYVPCNDALQDVISKRLDNECDSALIARTAAGPVGFVTYGTERDYYIDAAITWYGVLKEIHVVEGLRRRGIGRALVSAAEDDLRAQGVSHILAQCSSRNRAALAAYQALGFVARQESLYRRVSGGPHGAQ